MIAGLSTIRPRIDADGTDQEQTTAKAKTPQVLRLASLAQDDTV